MTSEIADDEAARLVDLVVRDDPEQALGIYLLASGHPSADLARSIEREVFWEAFGNSPVLLAQEYGPYEDSSFFICAIDHRRRRVAGAIRVITDSPAGFKSLDDIPKQWGVDLEAALEGLPVVLDPPRTWDIATLAVAADYRKAAGGLVGLGLYQALSVALGAAHVAWVVAVLDVAVLELLQTTLRNPFAFFRGVEPKPYLDSASSVPVWGDFEAWAARLASEEPDAFEMFIQGKGLEAAIAAPDYSVLTAAGISGGTGPTVAEVITLAAEEAGATPTIVSPTTGGSTTGSPTDSRVSST